MDKITDVIKDRKILSDFLTSHFDDFMYEHPDVDIITYFNTVALLLTILNQTFVHDNKFIIDIDGYWLLQRCLDNGVSPEILFKICS